MIDNPWTMVVLIVLIASIASTLQTIFGRRRDGKGRETVLDSREVQQLREEVKQLNERIQVLERITVEKENSLERQIEALRDR